MKETKNTDELIRARLENYSVVPPHHVWQQVQQQLARQKRRARLIYFRVAAVAAVVVLAFMAGWYFNSNTENRMISGTNTRKNAIEEHGETQSAGKAIFNENINQTEPTHNFTAQNTETGKVHNSDLRHETVAEVKQQPRIDVVFERMGYKNIRLETTQPELVNSEIKRVDELSETDLLVIAGNLEVEQARKKETDSKWKMGMFLSPGYSSYSASYDGDYSKSMTYSGSDGNANMGGGISVQYKTSKRWAVESGVYYAQNGQKSENSINFFASKNSADYMFSPGSADQYFINNVRIENGNMAMNSSAGVIQFTSTPKGAELSGNFEGALNGSTNLVVPNGEFSQIFEFVEIPFYVRYRLVDSRFGIELLTGFNTSMLVGNNAYISNQYGMQNIGETVDISTFNIAGTAGLGTSYDLSKHFSLALEPRFSYYLNSINKNPDVNFRPYRLGIFAGMTYTF